jgi:hypothetical protein
VRRDRIDDAAAEAAAGIRRCFAREVCVPGELDREQVGTGVEANEQLGALPLDRLGEAVGEERSRDCRLGAPWRGG